jgi:hypothetical protein
MPRAAPGPPGSAPLLCGCHAPRRSSALNALSGPRVDVPSASFRPRRHRYPNRLSSLIPTMPSPGLKLTVTVRAPRPSLSNRLRRHEHVHSECRPSSPLAILHPWSVELTFPSLLAIAGPLPATVAPPHRKNSAAEPVFSPSPSTRSSGELSPPPPCPAGSLTTVGARPPPFALPPPLWCRRRPCRDARPRAVNAPVCAALRHAVAGRTGRGRPGKRMPSAAHTGRASAMNVGRGAVSVGQAGAVSVGHACTVHLGRARFRPSDTRMSFSIF